MTTATHRRGGRAASPVNSRDRKFIIHLSQLSKSQVERLKELASLLVETTEQQERESICRAIYEIAFPASIGGMGDLESCRQDETRRRVDEYRKKVGALIKQRRQSLEMSQDQLSELAGIPQSHVSRLERGQHAPSHLTIKRIAKALHTKPSLLDPGFPDDEPDSV